MKISILVVFSIFLIGIIASQEIFAQNSSGLTLPHTLGDIAVDSISNIIYVSTSGGGQGFAGVFVFDGKTNELIDQIDLEGKSIWSLAINPNSKMLYVGYTQTQFKEGSDPNNFNPENIERTTAIDVIDLDTKSIVETIQTLDSPIAIAVNSDTNMIFVSNSWRDILTVIDGNTNSIIKNIPMKVFPDAISIDQNTNTVYVAINSGGASRGGNEVYVVDGKSLETQKVLHVGNRHEGIGVNPITNMIYVSNFGSFTQINNTVSIIDAKTYQEVGEIKVGEQAGPISIDAKNNLIYVQNYGSKSISVVDGNSNQVITEIEIGSFHQGGLATNPNSGLAYTAEGINVHVIDGKTGQASVFETKENVLSMLDIVYLIWSYYKTEILLFFAILGFIIFSVYKIKKRKSLKIMH